MRHHQIDTFREDSIKKKIVHPTLKSFRYRIDGDISEYISHFFSTLKKQPKLKIQMVNLETKKGI